jgi:antitoxin (DNA-binding transcriptional repressor) of toxin-antitoxin stability system
MQQVTIDEAKAHLPDSIEAALNGVEVVISKGEQPVIKLVPSMQSKLQPEFGSAQGLLTLSDDFEKAHSRQAGSAKGLIIISDDFDEPLEDFKEYME